MESKDIYAKLMVLYTNLSMENKKSELSIVELSKDINAKLDSIHAVLGFILEKTKLEVLEPPPVIISQEEV